MSESFDVIVIGGGTGGLVTASGCARLGRRVALIEKSALGGDCLWTGCVPTKALVASAKLAHQMRTADRWGLPPSPPQFSPRAIMESMREARRVTSVHDDPERFRRLGVDVIEAAAKLAGPGRVLAGDRTLTAKDIVIATGSRTAVPPIEGLTEAGFVDHASFLDRDEFPSSVLIVGGGAIGIEFAQIFRRFGARVSVVEMADQIIGSEDAAVVESIQAVLSEEGIDIRTGWRVTSVRREGNGRAAVIKHSSGATEQILADEIFIASGRRGNIEGLDLEAAGVATRNSFIEVDRYLQTSSPRIWAVGDVHGGLQFTHVAAYEAVKVVRNLLFPGKSAVDYSNIPWALYTDPEAAHLGLTEREAKKVHGTDLQIYSIELGEVDRAIIDRTTSGFVKLLCDRKGRIVGAHIVAAGASALIAEMVLARKKGVRIGDLAQVITPYPSLGDAIQKAAALHYQRLGGGWIGAVGRRIAGWSQ
jgi:pyruvate/2-oxoglutarate dehydrogenase complex dihydrolipoamide dehydrogenase (E3) component